MRYPETSTPEPTHAHGHTHTHTPQALRTQPPHTIHTNTPQNTTTHIHTHTRATGKVKDHHPQHNTPTNAHEPAVEGPTPRKHKHRAGHRRYHIQHTTHHKTRARTPHTTNTHGTQPTTASGRPRQAVAGTDTKSPQPGMARDQPPKPAADHSQEWRGPAPATHTRPTQTHTPPHTDTHAANHKHKRSTTHLHTPSTTPLPQADARQEWRGTAPGPSAKIGGGPPTTNGKPQPGKAGNRNKSPQPGMARYRPPEPAAYRSQDWRGTALATHTDTHTTPHEHTRHTPQTYTTHPKPTLAATPPQQAGFSQEWPGTAPRALSQDWRGTTHHNHHHQTQARNGRKPQPGPSARSGEEPAPPSARQHTDTHATPHEQTRLTPQTHTTHLKRTWAATAAPQAGPSQEWRRSAPGALSQDWRGTTDHQHHHRTPARNGEEKKLRPSPTVRRFGVWGLIWRVLDAFPPRGATWSGHVTSSPPGPSRGPSKTHLLPVGGVPRVHRARTPVLPRLPRFATPRSVHQFAAVAAGAYPLRRPPNAWSPGEPAPPGPCYWLVASGTPLGWRRGCLA